MNSDNNSFNSYLNNLSNSEDDKMDKSVEEKMAVLEDIFSSNSQEDDDLFNLEDNLPFQNTGSFSEIKDDSIVNKSLDQKNYNSANNNSDNLEQTKEIKNVELEELKNLKEQLKAMNNNELNQGNDQSKGKQKVLTSNPNIKYSDDVSQIVSSFISCFVLAFITAAIGTGWLINLIIHLK